MTTITQHVGEIRGMSEADVRAAYKCAAILKTAYGSRYTAGGGWEPVAGALFSAYVPDSDAVDPRLVAHYIHSLRRGSATTLEYGDESVESIS